MGAPHPAAPSRPGGQQERARCRRSGPPAKTHNVQRQGEAGARGSRLWEKSARTWRKVGTGKTASCPSCRWSPPQDTHLSTGRPAVTTRGSLAQQFLLFFLSHLRLTWPLTFFLSHPCCPSQAFALTFWNPESLLSPLIHPPGLELLHLSFQNLFLPSGVLGFPLLPILTRRRNSTASLEQRPDGNHSHAWSTEPARGAEVGGPQLCALWGQGKAGSRSVLSATQDITAKGKLILGS